METPGIFNISPEMEIIRTNELDYLIANTEEELLDKILLLKSNKKLFFDMIENGKSKDYLNPYCNYNIIVQQWVNAFSKLIS
jgi:hypothetical protein